MNKARTAASALASIGVWISFPVASAIAGGCSGTPSSSPACQGAVHCACYPNSTCNAGLSCFSDLCVAVPDGAVVEFPGVQVANAADASSSDVHAPGAGEAGPTTGGDGGDGAVGPGTNLVTNGDFSQGSTSWAIVSGTGSVSVANGSLCVSVAPSQQAILGWPEPQGTPGPALVPGGSYTLSFSAQATTPAAVDAKVGHTSAPYTPDFETPLGGDLVPVATQAFAHTFTAPTQPAEDSAGIAFAIPQSGTAATATQVCFQGVRLVQN